MITIGKPSAALHNYIGGFTFLVKNRYIFNRRTECLDCALNKVSSERFFARTCNARIADRVRNCDCRDNSVRAYRL